MAILIHSLLAVGNQLMMSMMSVSDFTNIPYTYYNLDALQLLFLFITSLFILLTSYNYIFGRSKKGDNDNDTRITIKPCPNPNCVRCQKYKQIQSSARRRLPHLIHEWKTKIKTENDDRINESFQLQRIIDGVTSNHYYNHSSNDDLAPGQQPTVLFLPRLQQQMQQHHHLVQENVSHLHLKSCHAFRNNKSSIKNIILNEYLESQINNAQWTTNHLGTIHDTNNNDNQLWEVLYLMNQGRWNHDNIYTYCPKTYSFIKENIYNLMENCIFGNVFISVLYPGTTIEPHCGPTNIRHRLHYALSVPNTKNVPILKVRNEIFKWEEGEVFVFDDSLVHSAEFDINCDTSEVRVVLVIDLWHPSLSDNERNLLSGLYPPIL